MKTIDKNKLKDLLAGVGHAMPISFSALTEAKVRKTGNPFVGVRKLSRVNAFTGADYERSVQRQQVREGDKPDFFAKSRTWGERIGPALVENKGAYYLVAQIRSTRKPVYFAQMGEMLKTIKADAIKPFLVKSVSSQPLHNEVIYRNYKLDNIVSISINGEVYKVKR